MNNRALLISLLVVALVFDCSGIVFLVLFLKQSNKVQKLQKERTVMAANMSALRNTSNNQQAFGLENQNFVSKLDGMLSSYTVAAPLLLDGSKALTLLVYLHGMRATSLEPFIEPKRAPIVQTLQGHYPGIIVLAPSYRANCSWANPSAIADIDQNVHELMMRYPVAKIVLMGTSMGGCSSLAYSYLAADDIKEKITGVVSSEGCGDFAELYRKTSSRLVQAGMVEGLGATPEAAPALYQERSINTNLNRVRAGTRFALISASEDTIIPPFLQKELEQKLQSNNLPTSLISVPEKHGVPPAAYYLQGLQFVLAGQ